MAILCFDDMTRVDADGVRTAPNSQRASMSMLKYLIPVDSTVEGWVARKPVNILGE